MTSPPPYLTAPSPAFRPRQQPAAALHALASQLRTAGITRLYGTACTLFGVLSVTGGLTVWTNGRMLWWQAGGNQETWPAADPQGAALCCGELSPNTRQRSDAGRNVRVSAWRCGDWPCTATHHRVGCLTSSGLGVAPSPGAWCRSAAGPGPPRKRGAADPV